MSDVKTQIVNCPKCGGFIAEVVKMTAGNYSAQVRHNCGYNGIVSFIVPNPPLNNDTTHGG